MSKLPAALGKMGQIINTAEMANKILDIKKELYRHENKMEERQYCHEQSLEKCDRILQYRNSVDNKSIRENEILTEGFVRALLEGHTS